jgi:hypothetical protein
VEAYTFFFPRSFNLLAYILEARTVLDIPGERPRRQDEGEAEMTKIVRATERNIKRLSKLQPGDEVRVYKKGRRYEGPYGEEYDVATVGENGFTFISMNGRYVKARLNLVVKTYWGTTDASLYLSSCLEGQEFIDFTDEAAEARNREEGRISWQAQYHIAIEIPSKKESK